VSKWGDMSIRGLLLQ